MTVNIPGVYETRREEDTKQWDIVNTKPVRKTPCTTTKGNLLIIV